MRYHKWLETRLRSSHQEDGWVLAPEEAGVPLQPQYMDPFAWSLSSYLPQPAAVLLWNELSQSLLNGPVLSLQQPGQRLL